ncbi:unnamed protein product [Acanthosepion pharaonis]|uniref:Uncharacterized protein n=1 Tax=Acanthosepion pharaonis TaxID=158019 RepID=A0A812CYM0_ACAPH|nr:unnamed protein product [Sepia pharaonis]
MDSLNIFFNLPILIPPHTKTVIFFLQDHLSHYYHSFSLLLLYHSLYSLLPYYLYSKRKSLLISFCPLSLSLSISLSLSLSLSLSYQRDFFFDGVRVAGWVDYDSLHRYSISFLFISSSPTPFFFLSFLSALLLSLFSLSLFLPLSSLYFLSFFPLSFFLSLSSLPSLFSHYFFPLPSLFSHFSSSFLSYLPLFFFFFSSSSSPFPLSPYIYSPSYLPLLSHSLFSFSISFFSSAPFLFVHSLSLFLLLVVTPPPPCRVKLGLLKLLSRTLFLSTDAIYTRPISHYLLHLLSLLHFTTHLISLSFSFYYHLFSFLLILACLYLSLSLSLSLTLSLSHTSVHNLPLLSCNPFFLTLFTTPLFLPFLSSSLSIPHTYFYNLIFHIFPIHILPFFL